MMSNTGPAAAKHTITRRHLDRNVVDLARSSVSLRQPVGRDHRVHTDQRYTHLSGSQPCFSAPQTGLRPASSDTRCAREAQSGSPGTTSRTIQSPGHRSLSTIIRHSRRHTTQQPENR